ncbi:MAG TPA: FxDxF family PEP-CTERM protein [Aquabacterium sp.]|uniref:FxDxF family PEP-CTERM protein n=1 Tax=Aquabacterium sp. TaxID=1872578 RepID=UPI002E3209C6|nr:FxDxF family PEP-CTERM protein [Aquabacterium sp.]HEX5372108.1 FxDxF family PEP-CTERM protein [Aquabacterium sp.]
MNIKHVLAAVAVAAAVPAWATTYPGGSLGVLSANPSNFESGAIVSGSFSDSYGFSLNTLSDVFGSVSDNSGSPLLTQLGFAPGVVTFANASVGLLQSVAIDALGHFSFADVGPGNYTLTITGTFSVPPFPGVAAYTGSVYASAQATPGPVPEPTSLLLALAGLGIVGFMLRRGGR